MDDGRPPVIVVRSVFWSMKTSPGRRLNDKSAAEPAPLQTKGKNRMRYSAPLPVTLGLADFASQRFT
jgi:hypothetical protein